MVGVWPSYVMGLPGLLIALLVLFTLTEPVRGASDGRALVGDAPPLQRDARIHSLAAGS